jgi:hypothetical protein
MDGFTLALCRAEGCAGDPTTENSAVEQALAETTNRCRNGLLVVTGCLLGPVLCHAYGPSVGAAAGRLALVQPCHASRQPVGPPVLVGPIHGIADAFALGGWLLIGVLAADRLPRRLRGYARALHGSAANWAGQRENP